MLSHGTAGLHFLPPNTNMNGHKYVEMLEQKLDLHIHIYKRSIFMYDGAPYHRFKVAS